MQWRENFNLLLETIFYFSSFWAVMRKLFIKVTRFRKLSSEQAGWDGGRMGVVWLMWGMLWCSDHSALCLVQTKISNLSERWGETVRPSDELAEWNLYSGQVCPARGYPGRGEERRAETEFYPDPRLNTEEWRTMKLTAMHSMFAAQTGLNVYFSVEKCPPPPLPDV